jgi:hypothetical protein
VRALTLLLLPATLMAQFDAFNATDSGLYFTSSLRLLGAPPANWTNVFYYSPESGMQWFAPPWGRVDGQLYAVSGDGRVFASDSYTIQWDCSFSPNNCHQVTNVTTTIVTLPFFRYTHQGTVQLSRNGRFALFGELVDLSDGSIRKIGFTAGDYQQAVADDGTVVTRPSDVSTGIVLLGPNGTKQIATAEIASAVRTDRTATRIAYLARSGTLHFLDTTSARDIIVSASETKIGAWQLSGDGESIALLAYSGMGTSQVFLARADDPRLRQLTFPDRYPDGLEGLASTPNGKVIYASTGKGSIVRIDVTTGTIEEIVPRTPSIAAIPDGGVAPGSLVTISGSGLSDSTLTVTGGVCRFRSEV